jgi:hypothetical protein
MRAILYAGGVGLVLMSDGFETASAWGNPAPSISFLAVSGRGCTEKAARRAGVSSFGSFAPLECQLVGIDDRRRVGLWRTLV